LPSRKVTDVFHVFSNIGLFGQGEAAAQCTQASRKLAACVGRQSGTEGSLRGAFKPRTCDLRKVAFDGKRQRMDDESAAAYAMGTTFTRRLFDMAHNEDPSIVCFRQGAYFLLTPCKFTIPTRY